MVGLAAICWALWKSRNSACFEDNEFDLQLKSFAWLAPLSNIGQGCKEVMTRRRWRRVQMCSNQWLWSSTSKFMLMNDEEMTVNLIQGGTG